MYRAPVLIAACAAIVLAICALKPKEANVTHSSFKAYEPDDLDIDIKFLPQMADEGRQR